MRIRTLLHTICECLQRMNKSQAYLELGDWMDVEAAATGVGDMILTDEE